MFIHFPIDISPTKMLEMMNEIHNETQSTQQNPSTKEIAIVTSVVMDKRL